MEHLAVWRLPGEEVARNWEERFGLEQVYLPLLARAAGGLLEKTGTAPEELTRVVIDAPLLKAAPIAMKKMGIPAEIRRREHYEKPSQRRKRKVEAAKRKQRRRMLKMKKRMERY